MAGKNWVKDEPFDVNERATCPTNHVSELRRWDGVAVASKRVENQGCGRQVEPLR